MDGGDQDVELVGRDAPGPSRVIQRGPANDSTTSIDLTGDSDGEDVSELVKNAPVEASASARSMTGAANTGDSARTLADTAMAAAGPASSPSSKQQHRVQHVSPLSRLVSNDSPGNAYMSPHDLANNPNVTIVPPRAGPSTMNGHLGPSPYGSPSAYAAPRPPSFTQPPYMQFTSAQPQFSSPFIRSGVSAGGPLSYAPLNIDPTGGRSADEPIDLTKIRIPTPPPSSTPRQVMCIGAITSRVIMLYPCVAAVVGAQSPPDTRERYDVREYRGAEFLKVKLKFRPAGADSRHPTAWTSASTDAVQVTTPAFTQYIGDLDFTVAKILIPHMQRGLLRLEGYVQRLQPEAAQFEIRICVMLFTLPSNVKYISQSILNGGLYLVDPIPPYDADNHVDCPPYHNPHQADPEVKRMIHMYAAQQSGLHARYGAYGGMSAQQDKAKQIEVQRQQVDDVFKSLDAGVELGQSDPGPLIRTELFPHQRKALTFLLEREGDASCLKKCRKAYDKKVEKKARKKAARMGSADATASTNGDGEVEEDKENHVPMNGDHDGDKPSGDGKQDDKGSNGKRSKKTKLETDTSRSLWEAVPDENGKVRLWRNKITDEKRKGKEAPGEGRGAILADDMGLGKTLSVVSLIAATRTSAQKWGRSQPTEADEAEEAKPKVEIGSSSFKNRVYGMPEVDSDTETKSSKKRKREEAADKDLATRQSRIQLRSRANLLVCPMSTITNWEDQIREHWNGRVEIVGGSGIAPKDVVPRTKITKRRGQESSDEDDADFDLLRIYVYHGSAKIPDPAYIADFDVVITSYNTLALEYSKMAAAITDDPTPAETADNSDNEGNTLGDTSLNSRAVKPEVEAEIKAAEVADRLRKAEAKKKGRASVKKVEISPLQAVEWFRVVLDEAHYIKSAATVASKASCYLAADRRIALTGTPIQNKIEDIWALFRFLRLDPLDQKEVFNETIWNPCKQGNSVGVARLQLVMRCCTLRRTKDSTAEDGRKILNLPPRYESQTWLDLREDERAIYDKRKERVQEEVEGLAATNQLGKHYAHVLQQILRLRQTCNHVDLANGGAVEEDYDGTIMDYEVATSGIERLGLTLPRAQSVVSFMKDGEGAQCASCGFDYNDSFPSMGLGGMNEEDKKTLKKLNHRPILTKCLHLFCANCFKNGIYPAYKPKMKIQAHRPCSACTAPLRLPTDVIEVVPPDSEQAAEIKDETPRSATRIKYVRPPGEKPNLSTKMEYLLNDLLRFSRRNPNSVNYNPMALDEDPDTPQELDSDGKPIITKSVVFSQWTSMLDRIGDMLDEAGIRYARLDGTMTREARAQAMNALRTNRKVELLLVSTRAGGVGLNLVTASRAYLVDPYWNPSVEAQAIDRIHRMGQTRPVTAIKLMINNSIEMKLDEIQKKKANLANLSLKPMSRKELEEQKAEELASLFR